MSSSSGKSPSTLWNPAAYRGGSENVVAEEQTVRRGKITPMMFENAPFVFRINENGGGPNLLAQVCCERGWREYGSEPGGGGENSWNLWWRTSGFPLNHHKQLKAWQFVNHIPKGATICRKDNLARHLRCMQRVYGDIYDFSPAGYNLPLEYTKLVAECSRQRTRDENTAVWICKPVSQSQGRGIFLFRKLSELCYASSAVVQRYIENPLLIGGYKFDLRLYVCVPSYHPLVVYLYSEGLARFGTDKFTLADLGNPFRHLTNSSLNKLGPGYARHKDRVGSGCKWTLKQLRRYFHQVGICDWLLWQRISALVVLTVLSQRHGIPDTANCFEFFGFDVLLDADLRPWLLEVNLSPALGDDCDVDSAVKKPMLHDMFDLLGLPVCNTGLSLFTVWSTDSPPADDSAELALSVAAAATRWRRAAGVRSASGGHRKQRATSAKVKAVLARVNVNQQAEAGAPWGVQKEPMRTHRWGNDRDWRDPVPAEGGWVRVYPVGSSASPAADLADDKEVKTIVAAMHRYVRAAREIARKCADQSDESRGRLLKETLQLKSEVWLPQM